MMIITTYLSRGEEERFRKMSDIKLSDSQSYTWEYVGVVPLTRVECFTLVFNRTEWAAASKYSSAL